MPGPIRLLLKAGLFVMLIACRVNGSEDPFRPEADRHGILDLPADRATLLGDRLQVAGDPPRVVGWEAKGEEVRWDFVLEKSGTFVVVVEYSAAIGEGGAVIEVVSGEQVRQAPVHATGSPSRFLPQPMKGTISLRGGQNRLEIRAIEAPGGRVMDLKRVRLVPTTE